MKSDAKTVEEYLEELPKERRETVDKLRKVILENLPEGLEEQMSYGMIGYVVPHSVYPPGYHCTPELPLPYLSLANQKNSINLYHCGIYASPEILEWFQNEWPQHTKMKLDMGKSCMRFKKFEQIPYKLIGELVAKMSVKEWIELYEKNLKK